MVKYCGKKDKQRVNDLYVIGCRTLQDRMVVKRVKREEKTQFEREGGEEGKGEKERSCIVS